MNKRFTYLPELDALRALAVMMTLLAHYIHENNRFHIPYMFYGVDIFFTISGFLITAILLKARFKVPAPPKSVILKNFFIKRVLRLFPLYYAWVFFFMLLYYVLHVYIWNPAFTPYFLTYFQNVYYFKQGSFNNGFSNFWSLGVEEQFYMVWPFVLLFAPKNLLPAIFIFVIIFSLGINTVLAYIPMIRCLTFSNLHTLGAGALFAWYYTQKPNWILFDKWVKNRVPVAVIALVIFIIVLSSINSHPYYFNPFIQELLLAVNTLAFLILSVYGWPKPISFITNNNAVRYIGKISYGIYLIHFPLPGLWENVCKKLHWVKLLPHSTAGFFIFYTTFTIIIASVSYHFFESRFLLLKEKFSE